jgi:hypothetical protein
VKKVEKVAAGEGRLSEDDRLRLENERLRTILRSVRSECTTVLNMVGIAFPKDDRVVQLADKLMGWTKGI